MKRGDFAAMRSTLDDGLEFTGPIDTFGSADAFLQSIQGLSQITDGLVIKKIWTDGPDVLVWYDLHINVARARTGPPARRPVRRGPGQAPAGNLPQRP
jgi:hypothetical protein